MLFSVSDLKGVSLHAADGDVGALRDLYFSDEQWVVRYFVVETGPRVFGKEVLISPASVETIDPESHRIHLDLTTEEIKGSPSIDLRKPVSRREEERLLQHYNLTPYWAGPDIWATAAYARELPSLTEEESEGAPSGHAELAETRLRSCAEVRGYTVHGTDGTAGCISDFIAEHGTWRMRYLVVNSHRLLPGKRVLISPAWVTEIRWADRVVGVELSSRVIREAPPFRSVSQVERSYESALRAHYGE
ncbi:MAG: PRC-barrel domain-containing protein [Spirochaetaceae bacterium]